MRTRAPLLRLLAACALAAAASAAAPPASAAVPAFQDEVRAASSAGTAAGAGAGVRRVTSGFQDSAWASAVAVDGAGAAADEAAPGVASASASAASRASLYAEPFALASDSALHALLDAAADRVLALARAADTAHDGRLRGGDVRACVAAHAAAVRASAPCARLLSTQHTPATIIARRLLRLVLNPDGAPLSAGEEARLVALLSGYTRKQGIEVVAAAAAGAPPQVVVVPRALLHAYPTLFFLREAAAELRALRARTRAREAAAAAAAAAASVSIDVDSGGSVSMSSPARL